MIINASDLVDEISHYYDHGLPRGDRTGWENVDKFYSVLPGQFTVITGIPSHGKSEWLDALMVNLSKDWQFCVFSPENFPHQLHIAKLLEKYHRKPFGAGIHERIPKSALPEGILYSDEHFGFYKPVGGLQIPDIGTILDAASAWFSTRNRPYKRGLVIDPWNELEHQRPDRQSETEYISHCLSQVRQWAREWEVHVWIVAHPMKLQKDKNGDYPVPTPYDISGSAHWRNKADNCIAVWRDVGDTSKPTQIHVQKVRFKNIGEPGIAELKYDKVTGRYLVVPSVVEIDRYRRAAGGDD